MSDSKTAETRYHEAQTEREKAKEVRRRKAKKRLRRMRRSKMRKLQLGVGDSFKPLIEEYGRRLNAAGKEQVQALGRLKDALTYEQLLLFSAYEKARDAAAKAERLYEDAKSSQNSVYAIERNY